MSSESSDAGIPMEILTREGVFIDSKVQTFPFSSHPCLLSLFISSNITFWEDGIMVKSNGSGSESLDFSLLSSQASINPEGMWPQNRWFSANTPDITRASLINMIGPGFSGVRAWSHNYQHFMIESFPLYFYVFHRLPEVRNFICLDLPFVSEIIKRCFPQREIIRIQRTTAYASTQPTIFSTPIARNFGVLPGLVIQSLKYLRSTFLKDLVHSQKERDSGRKLLYLRRSVHPGNAGNNRVINNEALLFSLIESLHGDTISLEALPVFQKASTVFNNGKPLLVVSPVGANLMNLIFLPTGSKVIVINHPIFHAQAWFQNLLRSVVGDIELVFVEPQSVESSGAYAISTESIRAHIDI